MSRSMGWRIGNGHCRCICRSVFTRNVSKNALKEKTVKIPDRIERGPTDILKALAGTVGRDYTAPHYKFHDDPFLVPFSNYDKRNFSLAKESGRKTAKWIRQQHADLFQHRFAEPVIEAFIPTLNLTEEHKISVQDLNKFIDLSMVEEAIEAYNLLKTQEIEIPEKSRQALLQLVCYYNENAPVDEEFIEERWYWNTALRERLKNTWKAKGFAETLFSELTEPDLTSYCAMIRGAAKFRQAEKAMELYSSLKEKELVIDTKTYNCLIQSINPMAESYQARWELIQGLLQDMDTFGLPPDVGTLNSILDSLTYIGNIGFSKHKSMDCMAEFRGLNIEPSLATYYFLIKIHCRENGPPSHMLNDIMEEIAGKEFTIKHPMDINFFFTAMEICSNQLKDLQLASKIDALLHIGGNYDFIGDAIKESVYYRNFIYLLCEEETWDVFMKFYSKLVPHIYTPEPSTMEAVLKAAELNGAISSIPLLWSQIIMFDHSKRENILALILKIIRDQYPEDNKLEQTLAEISWNIWTIFETQENYEGQGRPPKLLWTGKMLADIAFIQVKIGNLEFAFEIILKLINSEKKIAGVPDVEALQVFLDSAVQHSKPEMALACIQLSTNVGFPESNEMAKKAVDNLNFDSMQLTKLKNILGYDISKKEET